jgi:hypothetical protein
VEPSPPVSSASSATTSGALRSLSGKRPDDAQRVFVMTRRAHRVGPIQSAGKIARVTGFFSAARRIFDGPRLVTPGQVRVLRADRFAPRLLGSRITARSRLASAAARSPAATSMIARLRHVDAVACLDRCRTTT